MQTILLSTTRYPGAELHEALCRFIFSRFQWSGAQDALYNFMAKKPVEDDKQGLENLAAALAKIEYYHRHPDLFKSYTPNLAPSLKGLRTEAGRLLNEVARKEPDLHRQLHGVKVLILDQLEGEHKLANWRRTGEINAASRTLF